MAQASPTSAPQMHESPNGEAAVDPSAAARFLFDASPLGVIIQIDRRPVYVNPAWAQIYGYTRREVLAMDTVASLLAPEERPRMAEYTAARLAGRPAPSRYRYKGIRRNGSAVYLEMYVQLIPWYGQTAIQGMVTDVIDQELAREADENHQRLVGTIESAFDAYALWDANERLISCNERFKAIYPEIREHLVPGASFEALLRIRVEEGKVKEALGCSEEWMAERLRRFRNPGAAFDLELENGQWMQIRDRRLPDGSVLLATADITERKKAEQELAGYKDHLQELVEERTYEVKAQKEQLEEALRKEQQLNGLQRQFVAMVSHEFRTPLTIVDLTSQRIVRRLDKMSPEQIAENLKATRVAIRRLTDLIDSVLSAADIEDGRISFESESCDLRQILIELATSYGELYPGHRMVTALDDLRTPIVGDGKLLKRVFSNLIGNATKYAPDQTTVTISGKQTDDGGAAISIRDEGPGIPENEVSRIFERFYRATTSTGIAGAGIGLHLARYFVQLHGGTIEVVSKVGEGTVFHVHLPAFAAAS